jgi:hypothetical protein
MIFDYWMFMPHLFFSDQKNWYKNGLSQHQKEERKQRDKTKKMFSNKILTPILALFLLEFWGVSAKSDGICPTSDGLNFCIQREEYSSDNQKRKNFTSETGPCFYQKGKAVSMERKVENKRSSHFDLVFYV